MNPLASRDRRRAAAAILCGLCLALSTVAWPWLRAAVLSPLALIVWLFLRVLVLSIHQAVYWTVLVAAVPILLAVALHRRLLLQPPAAPGAPPPRPLPIDDWHWVVAQTADGTPDLPSMGWDGFVRLAVELKAIERRAPADYRLHDALREGRIPLPPGVHAFLFPAPEDGRRGPGARLRRLAGAPRRAFRRLSGRDRAERLRAMSRLLSYLEDSLEMPSHDDGQDRAHR